MYLGKVERRVLRWHDGEDEDITLADHQSTIVEGIDRDGDVVGTTNLAQGTRSGTSGDVRQGALRFQS